MQDIAKHRVVNVVAVQNHGRSGSTFLQSLLDGHPNILSTPNFYSREYFELWDKKIADAPDAEKQAAFIDAFPIWFDTAYVDQAAGLHRLGPNHDQIAHVRKDRFEELLGVYFEHNEMTRRNLFVGAHLAYGLCLERDLAEELWVLFPIHGRPKAVANALLEDFPKAKFLYTVREPLSNFASGLAHFRTSNLDYAGHPVIGALGLQFCRTGNATKELCTDTPYRKSHRATGQAKAVRLEDLHARPEHVMRSVISWLHLPWHDCLLNSTFDGKIWWNRPESPKQSGFGGHMLNRNIQRRLSALDRFRVTTIARPQAQAWGYRARRTTPLAELWRVALFAATVWVPWRDEVRTGPSPYRVVDMLAKCRRALPKPLRDQVDHQISREKRRNNYLVFDNGVRGIRAQRPDADKPKWVQCMIVLYPDPEKSGYKGKVFEDFPVPESRKNRDYAVVRFVDELSSRPDRRGSPSALRVLLGAARLSLIVWSYLATRYWTTRAYLQARRHHGQEVELLEIDDHAGSPARDPATPRLAGKVEHGSRSAA